MSQCPLCVAGASSQGSLELPVGFEIPTQGDINLGITPSEGINVPFEQQSMEEPGIPSTKVMSPRGSNPLQNEEFQTPNKENQPSEASPPNEVERIFLKGSSVRLTFTKP